jgi:hypothetical protein
MACSCEMEAATEGPAPLNSLPPSLRLLLVLPPSLPLQLAGPRTLGAAVAAVVGGGSS